MAGSLKDRRIVITGVTRGIGYETAKLFLQEGADIIGVGKQEQNIKKVADEFKAIGPFQGIACDISMPGFQDNILDAVNKRWGALDILINNAGIMIAWSSLMKDSVDSLKQMMEVNLMAPFTLTRALIPYLLKGKEPRIINTSSGAGTLEALHNTDIAGYRLSKWSLNGLTVLLSVEYKDQIAINSFDPGWVKTDLGGQQAPGTPLESAEGALSLATKPFSETGKFWHAGKEIAY